jgi:hypothetical protein
MELRYQFSKVDAAFFIIHYFEGVKFDKLWLKIVHINDVKQT